MKIILVALGTLGTVTAGLLSPSFIIHSMIWGGSIAGPLGVLICLIGSFTVAGITVFSLAAATKNCLN